MLNQQSDLPLQDQHEWLNTGIKDKTYAVNHKRILQKQIQKLIQYTI